MNRLVSRVLALLLLPAALFGQTAQVPATTANGSCTTPPTGVTFTVPKAGQKVTINFPAATGTASVNVPSQNAPVILSGYTFSFTIDLTHATVSSDGKTITGAVLNIVSPSK